MPYEEIAADLPPPGDDEPASLRQDLLDELADHLACAMARETQLEQVVRQDPGSTAWGRVVAQFGNPRAVMFRLWREAMWERLMMQRVVSWMMIVTLGTLCLGMVFVVRSVNQQQLAMAQQQQAMALQQQEIAATLQRISEQSAREGAVNKSATSIEWVPVEISLSAVDPAKTLPPGFKVRLIFQGTGPTMPPWEATTNESSKIRFPLVHYGRYILSVVAPWGEWMSREISVNPATPLQMTVLCPNTSFEPVTVRPELVLPDDLKQRSLHVRFYIGGESRNFGDWKWNAIPNGSRNMGEVPSALLGTDGRLRSLHKAFAPLLQRTVVYSKDGVLEGVRWQDASLGPNERVELFIDQDFPDRERRTLYRIEQVFTVDRDVRFDILPADGKLRIELTEEGLARVREILPRFDEMISQGKDSLQGVAGAYGSDVPAVAVPTSRP